MISALDETMTGTYLVTTQGSTHLWNLDEKWYIRNPGPGSKSRGIPGDFNGRKIYWTRVERWPKIDDMFLTIIPSDVSWHRSSTIRSIEAVEL